MQSKQWVFHFICIASWCSYIMDFWHLDKGANINLSPLMRTQVIFFIKWCNEANLKHFPKTNHIKCTRDILPLFFLFYARATADSKVDYKGDSSIGMKSTCEKKLHQPFDGEIRRSYQGYHVCNAFCSWPRANILFQMYRLIIFESNIEYMNSWHLIIM